MANYSKSKNKNTVFGGTKSILVPKGSTGERNGSPIEGEVRYNTDLGFLEQYNAAGWAGIDAPPTVSNSSGTINEDTDSTITITGSNFKSGSTVSIEGAGVNNVSRNLSTTFVNSGELTAATNASSVSYVGGASYNIKVTNPSGLSAILEPAGTIDRDPVWSTGQGNLGIIYDIDRGSKTFTVVANDPDGTGVTYSIVSGAVPTGMSFNTSNGQITGTPNAVGSNQNFPFTVRATSNGNSEDRSFSIDVYAPQTQTFSYTGSDQTWTAPSGLTSFIFKAWGAGAGNDEGGTAPSGAGGFTLGTVTKSGGVGGDTFRVVVGQGGPRGVGAGNTRTSYGGGGYGSVDSGGGHVSGGGGGLTGLFAPGGTVFSGVTPQSGAFARSILIAGGGGGANDQTTNFAYGGAGGGTEGQRGGSEPADNNKGGWGGRQTSGYSGSNASGTIANGGQLRGADGPNSNDDPGGGGGYYGGQSGGDDNSGAGGGSGYVGGTATYTVSSANTYTGNKQALPSQGTSDGDFPGSVGAGAFSGDGQNGYAVIKY